MREHQKGLIAIVGPVPNHIGPPDVILLFFVMSHEVFFLPLGWICPLHVSSRHLTVFYFKRTNKRAPVRGQLRGNLQTSQPWQHIQRSDFRSWRLFPTTMPTLFTSLVPDSPYLTQIFCTLFFYYSWNALQLHDFKSHYIWPLNLNSIPITNGTHNYNAQILFCMCKTYVDNMCHSFKA